MPARAACADGSTHLWLRSETKAFERRVPVTPSVCERLISAGFHITVEQSSSRCFDVEEYRKIGCAVIAEHSWKDEAPKDAIIVGLKEIDGENALAHRHICFFHCYKKQEGWRDTLQRFADGGGLLWDLEYLTHANGRRVAAFGVSAGQMGMAVGIAAWCAQQDDRTLPSVKPWASLESCVEDLKTQLKHRTTKGIALPRVLVLGALGRCGAGACTVAESCGLQVAKWDMPETKDGGPFEELLHHEIIINCILLAETSTPKPFLTGSMIERTDRKLSVFVDVSCDYTRPHHPFPFYTHGTTHDKPAFRLMGSPRCLDVVAIDNLPTLIAKEASQDFAEQLAPVLEHLNKADSDPVWAGAARVFQQHLQEALRQKRRKCEENGVTEQPVD